MRETHISLNTRFVEDSLNSNYSDIFFGTRIDTD